MFDRPMLQVLVGMKLGTNIDRQDNRHELVINNHKT